MFFVGGDTTIRITQVLGRRAELEIKDNEKEVCRRITVFRGNEFKISSVPGKRDIYGSAKVVYVQNNQVKLAFDVPREIVVDRAVIHYDKMEKLSKPPIDGDEKAG